MPISQQIVQRVMENPVETLRELDRLDCEDSLIDFIKIGWCQLEPEIPFVSGWAVEAICDHLQAVSEGHLKRLVINVPPGTTKSMTTSVFLPAYEWGPKNMPSLRYINCSYAQELSIRDNVRGRDLIQSEWYQHNWGDHFQFKEDQNAKTHYVNSRSGWRKASSSRATLTGWRGDRIIIDDPHSVGEADSEQVREETLRWFTETVPTRLNKLDESAIIVIMQRVHERDISGLILAKELGYEHLMLPMEFEPERKCYTSIGFEDPRTKEGELLWPERFSKDSVEELKNVFMALGGTYAIAGQLQQRPAPRGGGLFRRDDFNVIDSITELGKLRKIVRGWDLASSKDKRAAFTVGLKMAITVDDDIIILDVVRGQWTPGVVNEKIKKSATMDGATVIQDLPQDPGQAGKSQISAFGKILQGFTFKHSLESGSKEHRARPFAAQCEAGNVYMLRAHWNDTFLGEAETFPAGEFMDQIDAASRAFATLIRQKAPRLPVGPKIIGPN